LGRTVEPAAHRSSSSGNGWEDAAGVDARARGLAEEAIWLARVLLEVMPHEPEVLHWLRARRQWPK
jgi:predicted RNA polymerase sigma factor